MARPRRNREVNVAKSTSKKPAGSRKTLTRKVTSKGKMSLRKSNRKVSMKSKMQRPASDLVNKRAKTTNRSNRGQRNQDAASGETILGDSGAVRRSTRTRKAQNVEITRSLHNQRANLLQLDDNLLSAVLTRLDSRSLFNASLSCKRLQGVAQLIQSWSLDVLRTRAKCHVYQYVFYDNHISKTRGTYEDVFQMGAFLWEASKCLALKAAFSVTNYYRIFDRYGPVTARLCTMIRHVAAVKEEGERGTTYTKVVNLAVPSGKDLSLRSECWERDGGGEFKTKLEAEGYEINANTKSIAVDPEEIYDAAAWNHNFAATVYGKMRSLQPVLQLLQTELGKTEPDLSLGFLFWFTTTNWITFFQFEREESIPSYLRPVFKRSADNMRPSEETVQSRLAGLLSSVAEEFKREVSTFEWLGEKGYTPWHERLHRNVMNCVRALVARNQNELVDQLRQDILKIGDVKTQLRRSKLREVIEPLMLRTSFDPFMYGDELVAIDAPEDIRLRLRNGKILGVKGELSSFSEFELPQPVWWHLELHCYLPTGRRVELSIVNPKLQGRRKGYDRSEVAKLGPVTRLLQQCIDHDLRNEAKEKIPVLDDMFVFQYLVTILGFSDVLKK